jgi:hypothetical protein
MSASAPAAGWTKLLAGAVAHDINNLAHGLLSAPALLGAGTHDASESAALVEGSLAQMRKLGARLRALAVAGEADVWVRIDDACADACAEVDPVRGQALRCEPIAADLRVRGMAAAVRTAIASLLEHAFTASPAAATIRLSIRGGDASRASAGSAVVVEIAAPEATGLGEIGAAPLEALLDTALRDLRGDVSLVIAGAIADALGGAVTLASSSQSGLVLALHLAAGPPGRTTPS